MAHRIAFLGDLHLGNFPRFGGRSEGGINARARLTLDALRNAAELCADEEVEHLVLLGDIFDSDRPEPALMHALANLMEEENPLEFHLLVGNHDMTTTALNHHAVAPFAYMPTNVNVYGLQDGHDAYLGGLDVGLVPWGPEPILTRVRDFLKTTRVKVLCLHAGLYDGTPHLGDGDSSAPDACDVRVLAGICKDHGITQVFAGHWHRARDWKLDGVEIHQLGAFCPTSFSDDGLDYGRVMFEDNTFVRVSTPKFHVLRDFIPPGSMNSTWDFIRVVTSREQFSETLAKAREMNNLDLRNTVEVLVDRNEEQSRVAEAAELAASQTGLVQTLRSYVEKMPTGVTNREEILSVVLEKLGLS